MADGYTKLFASITDSTIWEAPDTTRLVWITMLAMADQDGYVGASVPGLAARARVSLEDCVKALETFKAPDEWSRSKDFDGRRIVDADGGWILLNHAKYRAIRDAEARREQARLAMARLRAERKAVAPVTDVNNVSHGCPSLAHTEADTEAKADKSKDGPRKRGKPSKVPMPEDFGISDRVKAWAAEKGHQRLAEHLDSFKRKCAANGYRYVDWDAAFMEAIRGDWAKLTNGHGNGNGNGNGSVSPSAVQTKTVKQAMKPSETPLERDIARARHDCHIGMIDTAERDRRIAEATQKHRLTN